MTEDQAIALALRLATEFAAAVGDDHFVVTQQTPGQLPVFWVTDNTAASEPGFGFDPCESCYTAPVAAVNKPGVFIVEQNNTDGGGFVYIDPEGDLCFETSF